MRFRYMMPLATVAFFSSCCAAFALSGCGDEPCPELRPKAEFDACKVDWRAETACVCEPGIEAAGDTAAACANACGILGTGNDQCLSDCLDTPAKALTNCMIYCEGAATAICSWGTTCEPLRPPGLNIDNSADPERFIPSFSTDAGADAGAGD